MSHFFWVVIHPPLPGEGVEKMHARDSAIAARLAPFDEDHWRCSEEDEDFEAYMSEVCPSGASWDWYQIGGRWTGRLDGYDPTKDPDNQEVSIRGVEPKWPTAWAPRIEDTQPIEKWPPAANPYYVLTPEGRIDHTHRLPEDQWLKYHEYALQQWPGHEVTIVDCHS